MSELTSKQELAWTNYLTQLGWGKEDIGTYLEEGLTEPIDMKPGRSWGLTKYGGYRSIPESLVREAAEEIGIPTEELPTVTVRRTKLARLHTPKEGPTTIIIPRRLTKKRVPGFLKHELSHYILGHRRRKLTWVEEISEELLADRRAGKPIGTSVLVDCIFSKVATDGFTWKDAISVTRQAALSIGVPKHYIRKAVKWVRNYMDRYGIED